MKIGKHKFKSPIFLAPMAGYGDIAFRRICRDYGAALTVTEMVSAKGLCYGNEKTEELLRLADNEKPSCVQLFGGEPQFIANAAASKEISRFDILDINMGCPVPKITKNGEGSALMKDLPRAESVIKAAVKAFKKPVTVKFRLGWDEQNINAIEFAKMCEGAGASAITVHGRTAKMMYNGSADWQQISLVAAAVKIPVIGNGDLSSVTEIKYRLANSGCSGVALGRGALGHPEIFSLINSDEEIPLKKILFKHIDYMLEYFPEFVAVRMLRKHLPYYLKGVPNCKSMRQELNFITSVSVLKQQLNTVLG